MIDKLKNFIIGRTLKHLLDGNKGTNLISAILTPILLANVDYTLALKGCDFREPRAILELLKVIFIALTGILLYFVGKYPKVAKWCRFAEQAAEAARQSVEDAQKPGAL